MIRRLEIAQSMVHRPRVLFLDEPTVGLDPVARRAVWAHIARLRAEQGMTVFLTTHYMEEAEQLCQRVGILHRGQLRALGSPQELIAAVGKPGGNLNDVFVRYTGEGLEPAAGDFGNVKHARRTMGRMG
jgi:ABC-2 type transport system ATP-binding protein